MAPACACCISRNLTATNMVWHKLGHAGFKIEEIAAGQQKGHKEMGASSSKRP